MTRLAFVVTIAAAFLASTAVTRAADASCKNPKTQFVLSECAGKDAQAADAELNLIYGKLFAAYDEPNRNALVITQRAWAVYRDAECNYETALSAGGTIHPAMVALCLAAKSRARTKELTDQLNCKVGDLQCNKP